MLCKKLMLRNDQITLGISLDPGAFGPSLSRYALKLAVLLGLGTLNDGVEG